MRWRCRSQPPDLFTPLIAEPWPCRARRCSDAERAPGAAHCASQNRARRGPDPKRAAGMNVLIYLVQMALTLGLLGLTAFLWSLRERPNTTTLRAPHLRVLADDDPRPESQLNSNQMICRPPHYDGPSSEDLSCPVESILVLTRGRIHLSDLWKSVWPGPISTRGGDEGRRPRDTPRYPRNDTTAGFSRRATRRLRRLS